MSRSPRRTAITDVAEVAREKGVPVIADGGIKFSGDLAKAIAAGASCAMVGSMIAGTDESLSCTPQAIPPGGGGGDCGLGAELTLLLPALQLHRDPTELLVVARHVREGLQVEVAAGQYQPQQQGQYQQEQQHLEQVGAQGGMQAAEHGVDQGHRRQPDHRHHHQ